MSAYAFHDKIGLPVVQITDNTTDGSATVTVFGSHVQEWFNGVLPADERQAAAQALAGDEWVVTSAKQPGPPNPIDPADVKVGDVVEMTESGVVEKVTNNTTGTRSFLLRHGSGIRSSLLVTSDTTVRLVRRAEPEPDPAQVEALVEVMRSLPPIAYDSREDYARDLVRRGVTVGGAT